MNACLLVRVCALFLVFIPQMGFCFGDMSFVNESGWTILITYKRPDQSRMLTKLLESGESLNFGHIDEAILSGYGAVWSKIAPKPYNVFALPLPLLLSNDQEPVTVQIKGIDKRSLHSPFGSWHVEFIKGQNAGQVKPYAALLQQPHLIGVFPTVDRTCVLTPRFVLGLPNNAIRKADAIDAENMLSDKWLAVKDVAPEKVATIVLLLSQARAAYEKGLENVPMTIPVKLREQLGLMRRPTALEA